MPKVRERQELQWLVDMGKQFGLSLDVLQPLYVAFLDHVFPEIDKSSSDAREAAYQRIFDYVESLEPDQTTTVKEAMRIGQLKATSRSDNWWTRDKLKGIGLLERHPKTGETFVRLIADNSGDDGDTNTADTATDKNGKDKDAAD